MLFRVKVLIRTLEHLGKSKKSSQSGSRRGRVGYPWALDALLERVWGLVYFFVLWAPFRLQVQ